MGLSHPKLPRDREPVESGHAETVVAGPNGHI
jgi:hypothetical protein